MTAAVDDGRDSFAFSSIAYQIPTSFTSYLISEPLQIIRITDKFHIPRRQAFNCQADA
jgi:hypothetical protein